MNFIFGAGHTLNSGAKSKLDESVCTREIAKRCAELLSCKYIHIDEDNSSENDDILKRAEIVNSEACDLYVEIHMGAGGANGIRILFPINSSKSLKSISSNLINSFIKSFKIPNGETHEESMLLFNELNCPSIIIECGDVDSGFYEPELMSQLIVESVKTFDPTDNSLSGEWKSGWNQDNKGWFYVYNLESKLYYKDEWKQIDSIWYLFDESGYAYQNCWKLKDDKWYYFDNDCHMCTNTWLLTLKNDNWYWLDENGFMLQQQWKKYNDSWYYLKENGTLAMKEWIKDNDDWYYLSDNGKMLSKQLFESNGKTYYLDESGKMVKSCTINIDGLDYTFDDKGRLED